VWYICAYTNILGTKLSATNRQQNIFINTKNAKLFAIHLNFRIFAVFCRTRSALAW